jgi:hypothetical protein
VVVSDPEEGVVSLTINARIVPGPLKVEAVALEENKPVARVAGGIGDEITPQIQSNLVKFFKAKQAWVTTMVLQDMPTGNCGDPATDRPRSPEAADQWRMEVEHVIGEKINHPSIVCWNLFNEAFGGFDYARHTAWAQRQDPSRLINASSGFPWHGGGDVLDAHGRADASNP